jgi:protein-S-isoprenylcysteine O-methyltransferase Ste14
MNTLKTILYMGSTHGLFTVYVPYLLAARTPSFDVGVFRHLAFPFWILGALVIIQCSADMIRRGRGTPAFVDPPKQLVIAGWYRYVRNPIYLGALVVHLGFIVWFGSLVATLYACLFFTAYHSLIVVVEEPILRKNFGEAYEAYCRAVPRWVPRLR